MRDKFGLKSFLQEYPDEDTCLLKLFRLRFFNDMVACPKCGTVGAKYYRVKVRKCFECGTCAHHIYPLAGTIMEGSKVPLNIWFYALFLFANSKNGISAKELERLLEVTYKTALRMGHQIRKLMAPKNDSKLSGTVEIDESLFGWKSRAGTGKRGWEAENKTTLLGMLERGYRVRTIPITKRDRENIYPVIFDHVHKGSHICTDEYKAYRAIIYFGYTHSRVNHSRFEWSRGRTHTNSIEGYWSNLKKSIFGTHTWVSDKHLQKYLDEHAFRYSHRKSESLFSELLSKL